VSNIRVLVWSAKAKITAACKECSQRLGTRPGRLSRTLPSAAASDVQAIEVRSTAILNAPRLTREISLDRDRRRIVRFFVIFVTRLKLPKLKRQVSRTNETTQSFRRN